MTPCWSCWSTVCRRVVAREAVLVPNFRACLELKGAKQQVATRQGQIRIEDEAAAASVGIVCPLSTRICWRGLVDHFVTLIDPADILLSHNGGPAKWQRWVLLALSETVHESGHDRRGGGCVSAATRLRTLLGVGLGSGCTAPYSTCKFRRIEASAATNRGRSRIRCTKNWPDAMASDSEVRRAP